MSIHHSVRLTSSEIAALWSAYISNSMAVCLAKYFLKYYEDEDVKPLVAESLECFETHLADIRQIFTVEKFPIPKGYSDEDVNLSAPALFFNLFPLSFIYELSRMDLISYAMYISSAARKDIRKLLSTRVAWSLKMFNRATSLMLAKGVYDRPAFIPYPDQVEMTTKKQTLLSTLFEAKRPLNVLELSDMFFTMERNYYAVTLLTALSQVVSDAAIQQYLKHGKKLANQQIEFINETLAKEDLIGSIMVNTEVTTSTIPPFSNRLILGLIVLTNSAAISFIGRSLSTATRADLVTEYSKLLLEIMKYGKDGMNMLIEREWLEAPPQAIDRKKLAKV